MRNISSIFLFVVMTCDFSHKKKKKKDNIIKYTKSLKKKQNINTKIRFYNVVHVHWAVCTYIPKLLQVARLVLKFLVFIE